LYRKLLAADKSLAVCAIPLNIVSAQGFQLPLTMVQQWQCHHLLDAAAGSGSAAADAGSLAALDKACHLLGAIACPSTPFRYELTNH
jgi:hypothetical protein